MPILLSITTWNKPIVQYQMLNQPTTRNRSVLDPSIAVQYTLIGVDKLLNPQKLPRLLSIFTSIILCIVL